MHSPDAMRMRSDVVFYGVLVALLGVLALICWWEPVLGDGWRHLHAHEPLTWQRMHELAQGGHESSNPRWGQLALVLSYAAPPFAVIATPLVIVGMLLASMTLIRGRWPRPSEPADAWLLVQVTAVALAMTPQVGAIWFYRPNCTNYIYPLAVQLAWLIPYRFLLARLAPTALATAHAAPTAADAAPPAIATAHAAPTGARAVIGAVSRMLVSALRAAGMFALGLVAGAGNEHTGVGLALGALACSVVAGWRARRLPLWTIAGVVGLVIGYVSLLTAPAQAVRYGGLAAHASLLSAMLARGIAGNLLIVGRFAVWVGPMLVVLAITVWPALRTRGWRTGTPARIAAGFVGIGIVMFGTMLAAPKQGTRLMLAPATMLALAVGVVLVELGRDAAVARRLKIMSVGVALLMTSLLLVVQRSISRDGHERQRLIEHAVPGSVLRVPRFALSSPTPFSWGDDFRNPVAVRRIAEMYELSAIEPVDR